jgi:hypothetical protein
MKAVKVIVGILGIVATAVIIMEIFAFDTLSGLISGIFTAQIGLKTGLVIAGASLVGSLLGMIFLKNKLIGVISGIIFIGGAAVGYYKSRIVTDRIYEDAFIWAIALAAFGVIYILASIIQKAQTRKATPAMKK